MHDTATNAEIPELVRSGAPQLFALYSYDEDDECRIEYWGMHFEHRADTVNDTGTEHGKFTSAESAHQMLSVILDDVRLAWL